MHICMNVCMDTYLYACEYACVFYMKTGVYLSSKYVPKCIFQYVFINKRKSQGRMVYNTHSFELQYSSVTQSLY